MDKNQREERRRQEDIALNRGLIWVGAAIVLELLLLLVNKYYINIYTTPESIKLAYAIGNTMKGLRIVALIAAVAGAVWTGMSLKKGEKLGRPVVIFIAGAALFFCAHIALAFNAAGIRMLLLLVPAWAALALVYYLYQREFFCSAFFTAMGMAAMWLIRHKGENLVTVYVYLAVLAVVLVLGAVVLIRARGNNGELTVGGRTVSLLTGAAGFVPVAATIAINVAAVVLGFLLGGTVAYYLIYALVAWLFGLLVYYTVKMM